MPLLEEVTGNQNIQIEEVTQGVANYSKFQLIIENSITNVIDFNDDITKVVCQLLYKHSFCNTIYKKENNKAKIILTNKKDYGHN